MKRKYVVLLVAVVILLITLSLASLVYFRLGYKEYLQAVKQVNETEKSRREAAKEILFQDTKNGDYGGILGYAPKNGNFILVWTEIGPKIFKLDDGIGYSSFKLCIPENIKAFNENRSIGMLRYNEPDYSSWQRETERGSQVVIITDSNDNPDEIRVMDVWMFSTINPILQCK